MDLCNFAPGAGKVVPRFKLLTCMVSKLMYVLCSIEHCDLKHTFRIFVVVYNNPSFQKLKDHILKIVYRGVCVWGGNFLGNKVI